MNRWQRWLVFQERPYMSTLDPHERVSLQCDSPSYLLDLYASLQSQPILVPPICVIFTEVCPCSMSANLEILRLHWVGLKLTLVVPKRLLHLHTRHVVCDYSTISLQPRKSCLCFSLPQNILWVHLQEADNTWVQLKSILFVFSGE